MAARIRMLAHSCSRAWRSCRRSARCGSDGLHLSAPWAARRPPRRPPRGGLRFPCIARAWAGGRSAPDTLLPPHRWRHLLSRAARRARPCWPRFSPPWRSRSSRRRRPPPFPAPCCRPRSRRRRPRKPRGPPLQPPSSRPTLRAPRARPSCRSRRLARSRSRPTAAATCRPAGLWWRLGTTARYGRGREGRGGGGRCTCRRPAANPSSSPLVSLGLRRHRSLELGRPRVALRVHAAVRGRRLGAGKSKGRGREGAARGGRRHQPTFSPLQLYRLNWPTTTPPTMSPSCASTRPTWALAPPGPPPSPSAPPPT